MSLTAIFTTLSILILLTAIWSGIYAFLKQSEHENGTAKVRGHCGDTMEITLHFANEKVRSWQSWTDGCSFSRQCVQAAVRLASEKTIKELRAINMVTIVEEVGGLPEEHMHCAQLAEITLQEAVDNYQKTQATLNNCHLEG